MRKRLRDHGEYQVYDASVKKLDERIASLTASAKPTLERSLLPHVDSSITSEVFSIDIEVALLKQIRERVSVVCMSESSLETYKRHLSRTHRLFPYGSNNKLRDVSADLVLDGHEFSWNGHIFFSFDACAGCESHAILFGLKNGLATSVSNAPLLIDLKQTQRISVVDFEKCPFS
jgi:hypothetical protein